jgi:hypothetical protein
VNIGCIFFEKGAYNDVRAWERMKLDATFMGSMRQMAQNV